MAEYISGYVEDRVNSGDEREYHYPPDGGLPQLENELFPDLEPSFVTALKHRGEGIAQ